MFPLSTLKSEKPTSKYILVGFSHRAGLYGRGGSRAEGVAGEHGMQQDVPSGDSKLVPLRAQQPLFQRCANDRVGVGYGRGEEWRFRNEKYQGTALIALIAPV